MATCPTLDEQLAENPEGCDFLLCTLVAALSESNLCKPAPPAFRPGDEDSRKEWLAAIERNLRSLPASAHSVHPTVRDLLVWLLASKRSRELQRVTMSQLAAWMINYDSADACAGLSSRGSASLDELRPDIIFRLDARHQSSRVCATGDWRVAYHGTGLQNLHSILHCGLLNMSGTRLQHNGALYGDGIYLSQDLRTAMAFTRAAQGWRGSSIGPRLRCVCVCLVAPDTEVHGDSRYFVARQPDALRLTHILVYADRAAQMEAAGSRCDAASLLLLVWVVALCAYGVWHAARPPGIFDIHVTT